jgi:hypothetical protein
VILLLHETQYPLVDLILELQFQGGLLIESKVIQHVTCGHVSDPLALFSITRLLAFNLVDLRKSLLDGSEKTTALPPPSVRACVCDSHA